MDNELYHYGILGMKWGIRRYQNKDGTLTSAGKKRYGVEGEKKKENSSIDLSTERYTVYDKAYANFERGVKQFSEDPKARKELRNVVDLDMKRHIRNQSDKKQPTFSEEDFNRIRHVNFSKMLENALGNSKPGSLFERALGILANAGSDDPMANQVLDSIFSYAELDPNARKLEEAMYPYMEYLKAHPPKETVHVIRMSDSSSDELYHYGILGMKWGIRRYQNEDGTLTEAGKEHYQRSASKVTRKFEKADKNKAKAAKANERKYKYYGRMNPIIQQLAPRLSLNYRLARYQEAKERKNVSNEHQNQKRGKELLDRLIDEYGKEYVNAMNPEIIKLGEKALVTYMSYYNTTLGDNWRSLDKIKFKGGGK